MSDTEIRAAGATVSDWLVENNDIRHLFMEKIRTENTLSFFEQPNADLLPYWGHFTFTLNAEQSARWREFTAQFGYMSGAQFMCVCSVAYHLLLSLLSMGFIDDFDFSSIE